MNRGLKELRPKRVDHPKAVVTLVRQLQQYAPQAPLGARIVMPFRTGGEADAALGHLRGLADVRFAPDVIPTFLDELERFEARTAFIFAGDAVPPPEASHALLARSLVAHSRGYEYDLAQSLVGVARSELARQSERAPLWSESLVVEERPGRALPLALEEPSLRQQIKKWGALPGRGQKDGEDARQPMVTDAGFGVGGILMAPAAAPPGHVSRLRLLHVASVDLDFGSPDFDLGAGDELVAAIETWLADVGGPAFRDFRQIYLAVPWLAVCAAFVNALGGRAVRLPDHLFGWHPSLTLVEMLATAGLPSLMIHTGRYPVVHVVALWP